jgi:tetratricopeptide (TPR) repeat protein
MTPLSPDEFMQRAAQARRENRLSDARRDAEEALRLYRMAAARQGLARALMLLGQIERDEQQPENALRCYEEAVQLRREEGDPLRLAHSVRHLADLYSETGLLDSAASCYSESLSLYCSNQQTAPLDLANALRGFALLEEKRGEPANSQRLWEEARALYVAVGVKAGVEECSSHLSA